MLKPPIPLTAALGKAVRTISKLRGGGSALPGLFVETIDKDFLKNCLSSLPRGVVVISGTNGKTTTTKMVVELLESQGLNVFTNSSGSNFTRGVVAALLGSINLKGKLTADIAVLELDEAHAVHFVKAVAPRYSLLLNVMRDQLDRFGEIDTTAQLLKIVADATQKKIVVNREDPRLVTIVQSFDPKHIEYFGLSPELRSHFPSDDDMRSKNNTVIETPQTGNILKSIHHNNATFSINNHEYTTALKLEGTYNIYNAVAATTLVAAILGSSLDTDKLLVALSEVTPAFGRGESFTINGYPLELVLVKNPSGFRLGLSSFDAKGYATMIAINDNYADGRDMSWLWDVNFESLSPSVQYAAGIRAYDMALRLQYDDIKTKTIEPNLTIALKEFINTNPNLPKRIYCTYTAMLTLRKELSKFTKVTGVMS